MTSLRMPRNICRFSSQFSALKDRTSRCLGWVVLLSLSSTLICFITKCRMFLPKCTLSAVSGPYASVSYYSLAKYSLLSISEPLCAISYWTPLSQTKRHNHKETTLDSYKYLSLHCIMHVQPYMKSALTACRITSALSEFIFKSIL
jgi:hypothetical protein